MSNVVATLTFSLPEDPHSDNLVLLGGSTKDGSFSQVDTFPYQYGNTKVEAAINTTQWYRLQFFNSKENSHGSLSEPVYGGNYSGQQGFLAVSSTHDGANYATTQDVYEYSGLAPVDISQNRVSAALRSARALIDLRTADMGIDRFESFDTDVQRRKYNASLRILKEAEINIALGNIYQNMADDVIIKNRRDNDDAQATGGVGIGGAMVSGDTLAERSENIVFLATLADRYFLTGEQLLSALDSKNVRFVSSEFRYRYPRFIWPFMGQHRRYGYWGW